MLQEQFQNILGNEFIFQSYDINDYYVDEEYDHLYVFILNHIGDKSKIGQIMRDKINMINKLKLNNKEIKKIYAYDSFDNKNLGYQLIICVTIINFEQIEFNKRFKN